MIFKQIESGGDRNYSYLIASKETMDGAIVDPSPDISMVLKAVEAERVEIKYVINTHSHFDHSGGNAYFHDIRMGKPIIFINCSPDTEVMDGQSLYLNDVKLDFIYTPGHTADSICIKVENKLITGDTLFVGKVGGTYSSCDAKTEFESLKKITALSPDTEVWPGHNYGERPYSTIGFELENNPFIKRLNCFDDFLWLKQNWASYKKEHNIK